MGVRWLVAEETSSREVRRLFAGSTPPSKCRRDPLYARRSLMERMETTYARSQSCAHHWVIDAAEGPKSSGRCKKCGVAKDFLNSYDAVVEMNEAVKEQEKQGLVSQSESRFRERALV